MARDEARTLPRALGQTRSAHFERRGDYIRNQGHARTIMNVLYPVGFGVHRHQSFVRLRVIRVRFSFARRQSPTPSPMTGRAWGWKGARPEVLSGWPRMQEARILHQSSWMDRPP